MMNKTIDFFKQKNFALYLISTFISDFGDSIFYVALTWLLIKVAKTPTITGTYFFILGITRLLFTLLGGIIADRFNVRNLLISTNSIRAIIMLVLFVAEALGPIPIWIFYIMAMVFGAVDSVAEPAEISYRMQVVKKEYQSRSLALLSFSSHFSAVVGPVVGALLLSYIGAGIVILINSLTFIISIILFLNVKHCFNEYKEKKLFTINMIVEDFREGISFFLKTPLLIGMAVFACFVNGALATNSVTFPYLAEHRGLGVEGYGAMNSFLAAGSLIGAFAFSFITIRKPFPYHVFVICLIQGTALTLIGTNSSFSFIFAMIFIIGVQDAAINIIAPCVNQSIMPGNLLGRLVSIMTIIMMLMAPISQAISGVLLNVFSTQKIMIGAGVLEIAVSIIMFAFPFKKWMEKSNSCYTQ